MFDLILLAALVDFGPGFQKINGNFVDADIIIHTTTGDAALVKKWIDSKFNYPVGYAWLLEDQTIRLPYTNKFYQKYFFSRASKLRQITRFTPAQYKEYD